MTSRPILLDSALLASGVASSIIGVPTFLVGIAVSAILVAASIQSGSPLGALRYSAIGRRLSKSIAQLESPYLATACLNLPAILLGIAGAFHRGRFRWFSILAVIFNSLALTAAIAFVIADFDVG
jgi:hypothetical protein